MNRQTGMPESPDAGGDHGLTRQELLRRAGGVGLTLAGASSLAAACGGSSSSAGSSAPAGAAKHGGHLRIAFVGEGTQETLDPGLQVGAVDGARGSNLFDTLFRVRPDDTLSNELAESFEANSKATEWTIRLRKGVVWHDGKPLTADDLIYTIKRSGAPGSKYLSASSLAPVDLAGITKVDPLTVRVPLKQPIAQFAWVFASTSLSVIPDGFTDFSHPIGTGPFKFVSWVPGENSLFKRNADYWKDPLPYVDQLTFVAIPDGTTRINALTAGQVDAAEVLTATQARAAMSNKDYVVLESPPGIITPMTMAVDLPPFDDLRVRQAFRLIADRKQLVEVAQDGFGSVGNDLFGKGQEFYDADLPQREQDIEQAKSLLHAAGADNLKVTLYSSTVVQGMLESANAFAQQARAAGVTVNVNNGPAATYYSDRYLKAPFMQTQWGATPISTWMNAAAVSSAPYNETHWKRPEFDQLVQSAEAELDQQKAQTLWNDAQKMLYDEGGYLVWGFRPFLDGLSHRVQGAAGNAYSNLGAYDFRTWWLE
jgi:peptide/nickel transport system substrate-binding protein